MPKRSMKILFAEDSPEDHELALFNLHRGGLQFESKCVDSEPEFLAALRELQPDIVVSDYVMPSFDGMRALTLTRQFDPLMPFIVLTGSMNEDTAVACIKAGANDYVIKQHIARLPFSIAEALNHHDALAEEARSRKLLDESEARYRSIFKDSSTPMLIIDPETSAIIDSNLASTTLYGWTHEQLITMSASDINTMDPEKMKLQLHRAAEMDKDQFQFTHRCSDGSIIPVEVNTRPIIVADKVYLFAIIHDISRRVAAEKERDTLAARLSHYLSSSPTITYAINLHGGMPQYEWISENVTEILGYPIDDVCAKDWWFDNIQAADRMQALNAFTQLTAHASYSHTYRFHRKDRSVIWLRDSMKLIAHVDGTTEIIGTLTDVSELRAAEAETRLKSSALEATNTAVVISDRNGDIKWVNSSFERLTGFCATEALGRNPASLIRSGKQSQEFYSRLWDTILSGHVWAGMLINKKKSGELYWEEMTITPLLDAEGRIEHFVAIKNDVTERVLAAERIESALREKEVLLKEIHHRVKNNMQVISSLLSLSAYESTDSAYKELVDEMNRRIETMAIVHDQFYESDDMSNIDFARYLQQLMSTLLDQYGPTGIRPQIDFKADAISLSLELAIPADLIVSELVAYAFKYLFVEQNKEYDLSITLRSLEGHLEIEVKNDSLGNAIQNHEQHARTLGLALIDILADQIHGRIESSILHGTSVRVSFPVAQSREIMQSTQGER